MSTGALHPGVSIAVIGAGIIGVSTAFELAKKGFEVVVYDPEPPGEAGPSRANAGHVGASDIFPLSTPGIHWKALKMLIDPDGPLKIPMLDGLIHLPWFWRFWRSSRGKKFETATRALRYLCSRTLPDTSEMLNCAGMTDMLLHGGCAFLYDTEKSFIASKPAWAEKAAAGFNSEEMDSSRIACDIPAIADHFRYAVLSKQWSMVRDPLDLVRGLAKAAESKGARFNRIRVNRISAKPNCIRLATDGDSHRHDAVIIAAGVNSAAFAKSCGDYLPMAAERGYNLTIPNPGIELELPLVFADRGVVATHLTSGLRIGGWAEYARPCRPPNQNHFKAIARISQQLFPGLNVDKADFWMGNRPSLPDSVPVISRSSRVNRIYYNCGHGHYGLTHAATSARLLCALLSSGETSPEQQAYSIDRFKCA